MSKKVNNLKSYFMQSMFHDGVLYPLGLNIAPKFDEDQDLSTGYKYTIRSFGAKEFNVTTVEKSDTKEVIKGDFLVYDKKEFDHHWNNETKVSVNMGSSKPFELFDNGNFVSEVSIEDEETIKIITSVDLSRTVVGDNLDDKSLRDGMFPNIPHESMECNVEIIEYFNIIANGKRLLHFSPLSEFFEVFTLPKNWFLGASMMDDSPKVFDDVDYDTDDLDLEEIKEVINKSSEVKILKR